MKHETRGAIVIVVGVLLYSAAVYARRSSRPTMGQAITQALGKEAAEIMSADAIALVPDSEGAIEVWPKGGRRAESLPNRHALAAWLCSPMAPRETAVVMLRGLPIGRGRLESASAERRLSIEVLRNAPIPLECTPQARFYSLSLR
jgi:hypothetical protein